MKVSIKQFDVDMQIKNNGVELAVYSPDGATFLGDLIVTKSEVIWCKGRTKRANGKNVKWQKFIDLIEAK